MDIKKVKSETELPNDLLRALWHVWNGNWEKAHEIAQSKEGTYDYDRIHAYLHREEGDQFNAAWWYRRLGLPFPTISLREEWQLLVEEYG